jgi:hypothetical protein
MIGVGLFGIVFSCIQARDRWAAYQRKADFHADLAGRYQRAGRELLQYQLQSGFYSLFDGSDPETPPIPPESPETLQPAGRLAMAKYHARMRRYWEEKW